MTPNCVNTISNMENSCQEIPLQGKDFHDSRKLSKVVVQSSSFQNMSLKTRISEKVPYSKSSCSRLISVTK